jgi:GH25 family lysozyme M1 (1,4-beta-N-acetylmuramidase)
MKLSAISAIVAAAGLVSAAPAEDLEKRTGTVQGFDISNYQGTIDFAAAYKAGARFVIIKVGDSTVAR